MNLLPTITPKSDQLNADDLIGRTMTITITKVAPGGEDSPVAIHFENDDGKPFKPCKSMRRVMVQAWGPEAAAYVGRRLTLYRDDKVVFGGQAVGGIRISHMSNIDKDLVMALTVSKAQRRPYMVKPLKDAPKMSTHVSTAPLVERVAAFKARCQEATTTLRLKNLHAASSALRSDLDASDPEEAVALDDWFNARFEEVQAAEDEARRAGQ